MTVHQVVATGVPATDYTNIAAAITAASDGDTIELSNGASGEQFQLHTHHPAWAPAWAPSTEYAPYTGLASAFPSYGVHTVRSNGGKAYFCTVAGTSASSGGPSGTDDDIVDGTCHWRYLGTTGFHRFSVSKTLTFQGVLVDGQKPVINGGFQTFNVLAAGKNVAFRDLHFKNFHMFPIYIAYAADVVIQGCRIEHKNMQGMAYRVSGENQAAAIVVGSGSYPNGVTGSVLVSDNEIDLHTGPVLDNADKTNLFTMGICANCGASTSAIRVVNNVVRNTTQFGLMVCDPWGAVELEGNEIYMTPWVHYRATDEYHGNTVLSGRPIVIGGRVFRATNPDHYGSVTVSQNHAYSGQLDGVGVTIANSMPDKWGPIGLVGNTFVFTGERQVKMGLVTLGFDYCYFGQNKFIGKVLYGIFMGSPGTSARLFGTDYNGLNGNNIQQLDCLDGDGERIALYFTEDAWNNVLAGGGFSPETVKFPVDENNAPILNGNKVTGYAPIHGGLGTALSTVIQAFHDAPAYVESEIPIIDEPA